MNREVTYLEEKSEWHPLVIAMKDFFLIIISQTTLSDFGSNMFTCYDDILILLHYVCNELS